jgi:glycosyltransferase involved in cell wall biosynthesis
VKIAYLINQYPQTSQSFIRREIAGVERLGHTVYRFTVRRWDQEVVDAGDREEKAKTRVILDAGPVGLLTALVTTAISRPARFVAALRITWKLGKRGDRGRAYHLVYLAEACVLLRWLRECGAEHVHAHFGTNSAAVALLVRVLGGPPYSFTCHGPEEFDRAVALKLAEKISAAEFAVAVSSFGRSQLYRWCPHDQWRKIHVVHCGVDASFFNSDSIGPPALPRLVCVGRLAEQKGQLLLLEAVARLAREQIPFELVLAGDGPMRAEIESLIARNDLEGRVTITGWLTNEQIRQQILASRALVLPSFAEGLPVVIMEALALGRSGVATAVAGVGELVADGVCGYLVPAGSVEDLTAALRRILSDDPQRLREMGSAGQQRVREWHDANKEAEKLVALLHKVKMGH